MKIAFFDCQFGAAGDMLLGALIAAGAPVQEWLAQVRGIALPAGSFEISVGDVIRGTIACKKVDVNCASQKVERHLSEIVGIIDGSEISDKSKTLAKGIFRAIADAEAKVHGKPVEAVHFHEVGAVDAIVDIVGFAIAYDLLRIERSYASAVPLGAGTVSTEHGLLPVPGPAVLNLLAGAQAPTRSSPIDYECLTPTGAAILASVVDVWGAAPAMGKIYGIGYGAGSKDDRRWPNAVRVMLGELAGEEQESIRPSRFRSEDIAVIEANLDDFSPQALSYAVDRLFEAGALDVAVIPAVMKKGRSGQIMSVLCRPDETGRFEELILSETSTIGVRAHRATRLLAARRWQPVVLSRGDSVRIKLAVDESGNLVNAQPEYEDCAAYATKYGVPLKLVLNEAISLFLTDHAGSGTTEP